MIEPNENPRATDLEEGQRRFEAIFNSPDSFIGVLAPDGTLLKANQTALEFIDATATEVEGKPFWETGWWTHSEEVQRNLRDWIERAATGDAVRFESTHRSPDGNEIPVDGVIRPVSDSEGTVTSLIAEARSIDERKRYEERLKAIDEATHRLLTVDTREEVGRLIIDIADTVLEQPLTAIWRYDADAERLKPLAAADAAADLDAARDDAGGIGSIPADTTEMRVFRAGDTTFIEDYQDVEAPAHPETPLGSLLIVPLGDHGQLHVGSRAVTEMDATTRELVEILARNATGALERIERERKLRKLHDVTREFMGATSTEAVGSLAIEAGRDVLGLPFTHLYLLDEDDRFLRPIAASDEMRERFDDLPEFAEGEGLLWEVFEEGAVRLYDDVQTERAKASDLPIRGAIIVPLGARGVFGSASLESAEFDSFDRELASILGAETEAALESVERDQRMRARGRELRRQNERLEEFTSVVSHDLRNPLNVATGRLSLAKEAHDSEDLERVAAALDRMDALIEDTLTLARQGRTIDETSAIDLGDVVDEAWGTTGKHDATLRTVDELGTLTGDAGRVRELLENLFRNAVEHGGPPVTVRVGRTDDGFYVEDDGPGIPEDEQTEVFDHGYTTSPSGTGLGLAIVRRIAEAHGWTASVSNAREGGARIEFTGVQWAD